MPHPLAFAAPDRVRARVAAAALATSALVFGAATPGVSTARADDDAHQIERHLILAEHFERVEADARAAADEYRAVLEIDPEHVDAALALAELDRARGDAADSLRALERIAARADDDPRVFEALGAAREDAGDDDEARRAYERAALQAPFEPEYRWTLIEHLQRRVDAGEAELESELADALRHYVERAGEGGRSERAELLLADLEDDGVRRAIAEAKQAYDEAFTETAMGRINAHMERARQGFQTCLDERPDDEECHFLMGRVLSSVKVSEHYDPSRAREHFESAPSMAKAHIEIAKMDRRADDLRAAQESLERALEIEPRNPRAHAELGVVYKLDARADEAVEHFAQAVETDPSHPAAGEALSELSALAPDHEVAQRAARLGQHGTDLFSTESFESAIELLEHQLGGVEEDAPEAEILEEIAARIASAADVPPEHEFEIAVLGSESVNALATPNGHIYFTRGFFDFLEETWPDRPIDADHDALAHVMAHEMSHVIREHTLSTLAFQEASESAEEELDPSLLTHVSRLHEMEADRDGIAMAFLAGYHPRGGIEFLEEQGRRMEIPRHQSHPTFDERVNYLEEYWSNDVRYAYTSFQLGLDALDRAEEAEAGDLARAAEHYEAAIDHFQRFGQTLAPTVEIQNNVGLAYARLGLYELAREDSPLLRWRTELSVERDKAREYVAVTDETERRTRGRDRDRREVPWQLRRAAEHFREAIADDPTYARAHLNLAATYLAVGAADRAAQTLRAMPEDADAHPGALANLRGVIYAERGAHASAAEAFYRAGHYRDSHPASCFNFARLYRLAGMRERARDIYEHYADRYPDGPWARAARERLGELRAAAEP